MKGTQMNHKSVNKIVAQNKELIIQNKCYESDGNTDKN